MSISLHEARRAVAKNLGIRACRRNGAISGGKGLSELRKRSLRIEKVNVPHPHGDVSEMILAGLSTKHRYLLLLLNNLLLRKTTFTFTHHGSATRGVLARYALGIGGGDFGIIRPG